MTGTASSNPDGPGGLVAAEFWGHLPLARGYRDHLDPAAEDGVTLVEPGGEHRRRAARHQREQSGRAGAVEHRRQVHDDGDIAVANARRVWALMLVDSMTRTDSSRVGSAANRPVVASTVMASTVSRNRNRPSSRAIAAIEVRSIVTHRTICRVIGGSSTNQDGRVVGVVRPTPPAHRRSSHPGSTKCAPAVGRDGRPQADRSPSA